MANIHPFRAYRYTSKAGTLQDLVTQPYDKISPDMQAAYLKKSPHNLVRVILGEHFPGDSEKNNVYTRAREFFNEWIAQGLIAQDPEQAFYAYFQEFTLPETGERLTRKGFIGLGDVVPYEEKIVFRHEQTLSGPKKDRRQVLEHTMAHFGQIFMLYDDATKEIDSLIDSFCRDPLSAVQDEYGTMHRLYRIDAKPAIDAIKTAMEDRKLLIADGHHRYETALQFRQDHPELEDAKRVMMTFVNMHSDGLRILATHRVIKELPNLAPDAFLEKAGKSCNVLTLESPAALKQIFEQPAPAKVRIGAMFRGSLRVHLLERERKDGDLDVRILHEELLEKALGISPEAVREEKYLKYIRGLENATDMVNAGEAAAAFLLEPTTIRQVAETSFSGGVMPQKSTDFYPKLLTGLTIYRIGK